MARPQASQAVGEPLGPEDLEILRLESPIVAGHTLKVAVLDPPGQEGGLELDALRERVASRIDGAPRLRRRLEMRGNRQAAWVDDPGFDLREHVRALPAGRVSRDGLQLTCARMMEERLDRTRPLWAIDLGGHHALALGHRGVPFVDSWKNRRVWGPRWPPTFPRKRRRPTQTQLHHF